LDSLGELYMKLREYPKALETWNRSLEMKITYGKG
jgi:hypothetical protein